MAFRRYRCQNWVIISQPNTVQGQTLQTVKWYKGSHEFYRYQPRNYPDQKQFFPLQKLYLNVSREKIIIIIEGPLPWCCCSAGVATRRAWCCGRCTRTCRATTPARWPPRSSTRPCSRSSTSSSCVSGNISIISIYTYLSKYLNSKTSTGSCSLSLILATSVFYPLNSVTIFNISVQHKTWISLLSVSVHCGRCLSWAWKIFLGQKICVTSKVFKLQKWFLHQNFE